MSAFTSRRFAGSLSVLWVLAACMTRSSEARADSPSPGYDPRDCVCTYIRKAPIDIFTAIPAVVEGGYPLRVAEILTHGVVERQVVGEPIADLRDIDISVGSDHNGPFLVLEGPTRDTFYAIAIPSLDMDEVYLSSMNSVLPVPREIAWNCTTEFSLPELKQFVDALAADEATCHKLATKYLGLPKPIEGGADNFPQYLCGGGAAPGSFALILGALGLIAARSVRNRRGPNGNPPTATRCRGAGLASRRG
jgi:hypothetical protein